MTSSAWPAKLVGQLHVDPAWSLLEDFLGEVVAVWCAVEDGDLNRADRLLSELVGSLRSRREEIEEKTRRGTAAA